MKLLIQASSYFKTKLNEKVSNQEGITTLETLLVVVIVVGIMILIFKPQITALFNTVLGIWATDVTTMFNNAQ